MVTTDELHAHGSARRSVTLPPDLARLRRRVARWALSTGRPLNLDAVTVILALRAHECTLDGEAFHQWTDESTASFLWGNAGEFCGERGVALPDSTAESLWTYFEFLAAHRLLAAGSSPIGRLREVLIEMANLTQAGRARHQPGRPLAVTRRLEHARGARVGR